MLDLKKYSDRAEADPGFKAKLLKNASQAIKDEFGEDLPCKLKCKEKLVFEVEAMEGSDSSDLSGVAGGATVELAKKGKLFSALDAPFDVPKIPITRGCINGGEDDGTLFDDDLSNVAGGEKYTMPADLWKEMMEDAGYVVDEYLDGSDCGYYFRCYKSGDVMPVKENYYPRVDANGVEWMDFEL